LDQPRCYRIITGTCYEHANILATPQRLAWFDDQLLAHIQQLNLSCAAWVVLPNHYHVLVKIDDIKQFARDQGILHGRTSFEMNREDGQVGRKVWYRCQDRCMRSEAHYFTTLNYIHNNPVKHGYIEKWGDWPYSSVHWYLAHKGRDWLLDLWREHPVLNYGDKWDV
jgi:putative transposase